MKMKTPVQMTDDLAHFIKETREDAAFPHESLYVDLLEQWKVLSRYQLEYADKESKRLYNAYWNMKAHNIYIDFLKELQVPYTCEWSTERFDSMSFKSLFGMQQLLKEYGVPSEGFSLPDKSK